MKWCRYMYIFQIFAIEAPVEMEVLVNTQKKMAWHAFAPKIATEHIVNTAHQV